MILAGAGTGKKTEEKAYMRNQEQSISRNKNGNRGAKGLMIAALCFAAALSGCGGQGAKNQETAAQAKTEADKQEVMTEAVTEADKQEVMTEAVTEADRQEAITEAAAVGQEAMTEAVTEADKQEAVTEAVMEASGQEAMTGTEETDKQEAAAEAKSTGGDPKYQDVAVFKNLKVRDLEGNEVDSSVFKDYKITIVNFWSTACPPCIAEIPTLNQISEEMADQGVGVKGFLTEFGAEPDERALEAARELIKDEKITYQHFVGAGEVTKDETVKNMFTLPTSYAVDSEGNVIDMIQGYQGHDEWTEFAKNALQKAGQGA